MKNKDYDLRVKIATDAFNAGCLLYSSTTQRYYSPREYVESGEEVKVTTHLMKDSYDVTAFYPKHAIESEMSKLREAEERFQKFMNMVLTAFEFSPIAKK